MMLRRDRAWWRAAGTAALLLITGAVIGIVADRLWLNRSAPDPRPLTVEAMVARLNLSDSEAAHVRALLLDSLHAEIHAAVPHGPDSLRSAVRHAQARIEAALPTHARAEFRRWIQEQYEHISRRSHGAPANDGTTNRRSPDESHAQDRHRRP